MEVHIGKPVDPVRFFSQWLLLWPDNKLLAHMCFPMDFVETRVGRCLDSRL